MHTRRFVLSLLALLCCALPLSAQDHLALITDLQGEVEVVSTSGARAQAQWGMQLFQGDVVATGSGAKASILFSNNNLLSMGANSEMAISGAATTGRSVDPGLTADVSELTLHRTGVGEIAALGGLRSGGTHPALNPVSPHNSRARALRPVFKWTGGEDFELYRVKVMDETGVIWSGETEATTLRYPDDAPALDAEATYFWQIEGEEMLDTATSPMVRFQVLSADGLRAVTEAEASVTATVEADAGTSRDYVLGAYYAREGLADEAISAFSRIADLHPDSAFLYEVLGKLYYETGRKDEAVAALQRAIELGSKR